MSNINKYRNIIFILCQYYEIGNGELGEILKKKENLYLAILLMKNFKCLNNEVLKDDLGIVSSRGLYYKIKKAEEKILINKNFREEYFELEEKIKEKLKNA